MDTSTGSFTDCPSADLYKEQKFCTTNQIGFTHQWFHAMQSFLMQPLTNCQGSAPFPEFALFTTLLGRVRLSQSGQWLADTIIVVQKDYNYGKRQSVSGSVDSAGMGQVRTQRARARHIKRRANAGLYQKLGELACFGGIKPQSAALRCPCISTLTFEVERGTYSPSNSPSVKFTTRPTSPDSPLM